MSDLVQRLRNTKPYTDMLALANEAADRIEQLERELITAHCEYEEWTKERTSLERSNKELREALEATRKDHELLNFLALNPNVEYGHECDEDGTFWVLYRVTGCRNDREWTEIGRGETLRAAISAAMPRRDTESKRAIGSLPVEPGHAGNLCKHRKDYGCDLMDQCRFEPASTIDAALSAADANKGKENG